MVKAHMMNTEQQYAAARVEFLRAHDDTGLGRLERIMENWRRTRFTDRWHGAATNIKEIWQGLGEPGATA